MRTINISTEVFAKIWAHHKYGEETEDDILRRLLDLPPKNEPHKSTEAAAGGFRDNRFGVHFPEGFEIFRVYKGTDYRACATNGTWKLLNNGEQYPSLHKLSRAVVSGHENSWENWKYDDGGSPTLIDNLRDPAKVGRRDGRVRLEDFMAEQS